jgi:hypothetical protein
VLSVSGSDRSGFGTRLFVECSIQSPFLETFSCGYEETQLNRDSRGPGKLLPCLKELSLDTALSQSLQSCATVLKELSLDTALSQSQQSCATVPFALMSVFGLVYKASSDYQRLSVRDDATPSGRLFVKFRIWFLIDFAGILRLRYVPAMETVSCARCELKPKKQLTIRTACHLRDTYSSCEISRRSLLKSNKQG